MAVSVVVCTRNEEKYIKRCLDALRNQTIKPEIVIVDGHSTDKTVSIAKKYADKIVKDNGKGIADARNVGWKASTNDIIAYCDADCIVPSNWIETILNNMNGNACIYGPLIPYEGKLRVKLGLKVFGDMLMEASSAFKYPCICAANMAVKKSMLKKHPFRYKILEDFDLGNRLRKAGNVVFCKDMYVLISTRRFSDSFHRTAFKYYLINYFRLRMGKEMKSYL